ncbi:ankyrin repeat domain-containing protein [Haloferula sp. A504]|uniref:ankyrin repeat domain-containing protein n=1 Tax=Haloferula sp. A504 TaxID=3373601 RepID=UPI0031C8921B|nr:ankyrin repeat domain-containing protein [Verrucomicrobiaceae bacterium E54]
MLRLLLLTLRLPSWSIGLALGVLALASCDSSKREAMTALRERGIPMNGPALLRAVEEDDAEVLRLLLTAGVYSGHRDPQGRTPLYRAVEGGQLDAAWLLVDAEADVNAPGPGEVTPLALAVVNGETALAEKLLQAGARPEGLTPDGSRLLPWAIRHGRMAFVRALMQGGADPHQKDADGSPLLHVAMAAGRKDLAMELIRLGADCGAPNADGESALVIAVRKGWLEQVGPLVRAGADPNLADRDGLTPLARALETRDFELARKLWRLGAVPDAYLLNRSLAEAYEARECEKLGWLLRFGADPSPPGGPCLVRRAAGDDRLGDLHLFLGYTGEVPEGMLYDACRSNRVDLASLLLAHGANPNPSRAPFLDTPFTMAVASGSDALALRLLDAGAHPDLRGAQGVPPLLVAIARGRAGTVRALVERGVDVNKAIPSPVDERFVKTVRGATMRWLLRKDSRITPIMLAADSGSVETARTLIDKGARKQVWTRRNSTWPINIAARNDDVPMMRLLLGKDPYVEEREVLVDLSDQELRVFGKSGEEIFKTKVSTGKQGYATRTGTFAVTNRYRHWTSTIYHASMPYFQRLSCSDFGFHRGYVPGYPASHGCIRVPSGNAAKLFQILDLGDRVRIVE